MPVPSGPSPVWIAPARVQIDPSLASPGFFPHSLPPGCYYPRLHATSAPLCLGPVITSMRKGSPVSMHWIRLIPPAVLSRRDPAVSTSVAFTRRPPQLGSSTHARNLALPARAILAGECTCEAWMLWSSGRRQEDVPVARPASSLGSATQQELPACWCVFLGWLFVFWACALPRASVVAPGALSVSLPCSPANATPPLRSTQGSCRGLRLSSSWPSCFQRLQLAPPHKMTVRAKMKSTMPA